MASAKAAGVLMLWDRSTPCSPESAQPPGFLKATSEPVSTRLAKSGFCNTSRWTSRYFVKGSPQGGIISPILANLALDGMQEAIGQAVRRTGDKVNFVRYADDFIVTGATQE